MTSQRGDMSEETAWISLLEYSNKYDVSISTLRRKIRSGVMDHTMDNGKYLVPDSDIKAALRKERNKKATAKKAKTKSPAKAKPKSSVESAEPSMPKTKIDVDTSKDYQEVFQTVNRMLDELKKAYSFILQEKESQIIQLNNELSDLKTLVRVLEDEVMKLRDSD